LILFIELCCELLIYDTCLFTVDVCYFLSPFTSYFMHFLFVIQGCYWCRFGTESSNP